MMGRTHKYGGFATGVVASAYLIPQPYTTESFIMGGLLIGTAMVGSLIPDIDHKNSTMGRKHKITSSVVNGLFGHRGITHAPFFHFAVLAILFYLSTLITGPIQPFVVACVFGLMLGILSHLLLDIITVDGIPLFYPLSKDKVNICTFKSAKHNTLVCILITIVMVVAVGWKLV